MTETKSRSSHRHHSYAEAVVPAEPAVAAEAAPTAQDRRQFAVNVQQRVQDTLAAFVPAFAAGAATSASAELFAQRCGAFAEAFKSAKDPEAKWKAFAKLGGR